jgi:hypothetical protein
MAIEKKTTKKTEAKTAAKKPAVKKAVEVKPVAAAKPAVKKPAVKAPVVKAPAVKKAAAKPAAPKAKTVIPQDRFYAMVSEAAYFSSQNDGNRKSSSQYWLEAEEAVRAKFDVAG